MFSELVKIENNQVVTTSLKIADVFEIQHKDLLDKIRLLSAETSAGLIISDYNPQFVESSYLDKQGKSRPMYYLNRDAFTELVGNMFGEKARKWKRQYYAEFNRMENQLKYGSDRVPQTFLEALELAVEKEKQRIVFEQKYIDAENRAKENQEVKDLYDATNASEEYWLPMKTVADVLDVIGVGRNNLYKFLREKHILSQNNEPMRCYQEMGYIRSSYVTGFKNQVICVVSLKGLKFIFKKLQNDNKIPRTVKMEEWLKLCTALNNDEEVVIDANQEVSI